MGNIGWTGIIIIAILVVILFGKVKFQTLWVTLQKALKFKKCQMTIPRDPKVQTIQITQILKINNLLCHNRLVRDFSNINYCNIVLGKSFQLLLKK